jgi:hypothetical protein
LASSHFIDVIPGIIPGILPTLQNSLALGPFGPRLLKRGRVPGIGHWDKLACLHSLHLRIKARGARMPSLNNLEDQCLGSLGTSDIHGNQ